jgi:tetratricopeptide (TPR) repeat protein
VLEEAEESPSSSNVVASAGSESPDSDVRLAAAEGEHGSAVLHGTSEGSSSAVLKPESGDMAKLEKEDTVLNPPPEEKEKAGTTGPSSTDFMALLDDADAEPGETLTGAEAAKAGEESSSEIELDVDDEAPAEPEVETIAVASEEPEAAVEESAEAAEEAAEKKPRRKKKEPKEKKERKPFAAVPRGRREMLMSGAGIVLGVILCTALWMFGIEPPSGLRRGKAAVKAPEPAPRQEAQPLAIVPRAGEQVAAAAPAPTADVGQAHLQHGEFAKAAEVLAKVKGNDPALLSGRGEARWFTYLQQKKQKNEPINEKDEDFAKARADLTAAKSAAGIFWVGQMEEALGKTDEARATYTKALKDYPDEQPRFRAALDRLDTLNPPAEKPRDRGPAEAAPKTPTARLMDPSVLLFTALQAPTRVQSPGKTAKPSAPPAAAKPAPAKPAAADKSKATNEEAGFEFWKATKLAQQGDYAQAIEALRKAREIHERRRFARLRQDQNPLSDPTEQIFLRSCDEMIQYWQLKQTGGAGSLAKQPEAAKPSEAMTDEAKKALETVASLTQQLKSAKLLGDGDTDLTKAVAGSLEAKAKAEKQAAAVAAALAEAKYAAGDQEPVEAVRKLLADRKGAGETLAAAAELLKGANFASGAEADVPKAVGRVLDAVKAATARLQETDAKLHADESIIDQARQRLASSRPVASKNDLPSAIDRLLAESGSPGVTALRDGTVELATAGGKIGSAIAGVVDLGQRLARSRADNVRYRMLLVQSHRPEQMLDVWLALLEEPQRQGPVEAAMRDARIVREDRQCKPEARAKALAVEGLALRNQGKLREARERLAQAIEEAGRSKEGDWRPTVRAASKDLSDPNAYFVPQAERLRATGNPQAALALIDQALPAFDKSDPAAGRLLALRSQIGLDLIRAGSKGRPLAGDARVARAEEDGQAAVAAGAVAEGHYALGCLAAELGQWTKAQPEFRAARDAHPALDRAGSRYCVALARCMVHGHTAAKTSTSSNDSASGAVSTDASSQADRPSPDLVDAIEVANQAIRAGAPEGHLAKAEVLLAEDRWHDALHEYLQGLQRLFPGREVDGLRELVDNQPALRMPEALKPPQPLLAEKHYILGQRHYWQGRYPAAETELTLAVHYNADDARYLYFLGLARLQQGRQADAIEAFRQAGERERTGKPSMTEIGAALERVQGAARTMLDREAHRGG